MDAYINVELKGLPKARSGKVRDIYDLGDQLLIVASDRISAFDVIMPDGVPGKGIILTQISRFWFDMFKDIDNHIITFDIDEVVGIDPADKERLRGRIMLVEKLDILPVECIVRGYLAGSGWKSYQKNKTVCGIELCDGLQDSSQLEEVIFTPSTKADEGHDENIPFEEMVSIVGAEMANALKDLSLQVYQRGAEYAKSCGIILCDTKFEFGQRDGRIVLADEVLTPDSSRFWPQDEYEPGRSQNSFDKQILRDYLETLDWDKTPPGPKLPADIIERIRERYVEVVKLLTGDEALAELNELLAAYN